MRTRTKGINQHGNERVIDKHYRGERIFRRLGEISQDQAEAWLRQWQSDIDARIENEGRRGAQRLFCDGARKYLIERQEAKARSVEFIAHHITLLLPFIGRLPMADVCNEALDEFKRDRKAAGVKNATINRSLSVVRTITGRAARLWRDNGKPWLSTAPLIEMLDETEQMRRPRPLSWTEQAKLLPTLPQHLQNLVLFALNTGARDENVCGLRWEWERPVPELGRSVFVVPASEFKGKRDHVIVLNDAAWKVVQACRGMHPDYVFVYRRERVKNFDQAPTMQYHRIDTMNNSAWQKARKAVGLEGLRVHDLRHAFGQRLREAGVTEEDRALLLGHAIAGMPQHYATATVERLVEAANKVQHTADKTTLLRVVSDRSASA